MKSIDGRMGSLLGSLYSQIGFNSYTRGFSNVTMPPLTVISNGFDVCLIRLGK